MKHKIVLAAVAAMMVCSSAPALADEPQQKPTSIEKRLLKIELSVALKQYKKLYTQMEELRFQERSPQANDRTEKEKKLMSQQEDFLTSQVDGLRQRILQMGGRLDQMGDSAKKAK
jgi:hypothetical protein